VNVQIEGHPVTAWAFHSLRGTIDPEVVAGRAPRGPTEVALGAVTLDALGKRIGDTVRVTGSAAARGYEVVGRIVLPRIAQPQPLADGASFTSAGLTAIIEADDPNLWYYRVARVAPDTDRAALQRQIASLPKVVDTGRVSIPTEVDHLRQIGWLPTSLTLLLGVLGLLAVGHALVTAVRRRRRELALLKVVGFDRRQVRATVAWQATTLATIGLVIGIPTGVVVGRVVWRLVADGLGVSTSATIPVFALILTIPCAVALVNLIAFLPARAAARIRPAVALRSE
jgi:hypothetical protein